MLWRKFLCCGGSFCVVEWAFVLCNELLCHFGGVFCVFLASTNFEIPPAAAQRSTGLWTGTRRPAPRPGTSSAAVVVFLRSSQRQWPAWRTWLVLQPERGWCSSRRPGSRKSKAQGQDQEVCRHHHDPGPADCRIGPGAVRGPTLHRSGRSGMFHNLDFLLNEDWRNFYLGRKFCMSQSRITARIRVQGHSPMSESRVTAPCPFSINWVDCIFCSLHFSGCCEFWTDPLWQQWQ